MKHFLVYTNRYKDRNLATAQRICDFLRQKGRRAVLRAVGGDGEEETTSETENIPEDIDCLIVLGGDGTVLEAARGMRERSIPIIGVNLGTLGYLTEIEPMALEESLERLIAGDYVQESRMMLQGRISLLDGGVKEDWALNDIVISRRGPLQIIKFNIYVNGQFLNNYSADGMIVTTPTGSTGYNLSAGGPLIEPGARLMALTPICPHSLNQRSIVLSPEDIIEIEISKSREGGEQNVEVNFDGSHVVPLRTGDKIRVTRSEKVTKFIRLNQVSFLEVLHRKMQD